MEHSTQQVPCHTLPEITKLYGTLATLSTLSALANKRKLKGGAEQSCTKGGGCNDEEGHT